jgi:hypothetical protein
MKIGRNNPCPCGSGRKYKRCCLARLPQPLVRQASFEELPQEVREAFIRHHLQEQDRVRRFGHVRPPISVDHAGHKVVAVGSRLYWAKNWKTFHDFLINYIAMVLGKEWGDAELKKPFKDRHPVVQWYHHLCELQAKHADQPGTGEIYSATATGPVMAYLALAYDLYTLEHHALLQRKLVDRLKLKDQFQGARYETYVAGAFVRAGFDVELEDEGDRRGSHCEFTATHRATGANYSVEAKSRHRPGLLGQPGSPRPVSRIEADVSTLLAKALRKRADDERVVFVDVNVSPQEGSVLEAEWFKKVAAQLRRLEETQLPHDRWPVAFVFFTNHPYHYVGSDAPEPGRSTIFTGINMPDFRQPDTEIVARKYPAIKDLFDSVIQHTEVPHEF